MKRGKQRNSRLLPNSLRIISSCLKTVSTNATSVASTVRSAGASVAASISASSEDHKDQVTWAGFDTLELGSSICRRVLLLGYHNGFQILDVEDALNFGELVSKRDDGPVRFLQMQPMPQKSSRQDGLRGAQPLLLVVSANKASNSGLVQEQSHSGEVGGDGYMKAHVGYSVNCTTSVRFYSLRSHEYVHVWRFRSLVCMVRCNPTIIAVGLAKQIYCFDALTLENKFSVLTYPVPQVAEQGRVGINIGYGPMALGQRWLAYASSNPLLVNSRHLSPQSMSLSAGASPSTSPSSSSLVAHYAMESGRQLASGIINLGDKGYKTLSRYCRELLPDESNSPVLVSTGSRISNPASTETDSAGLVVVRDCVSGSVISQFRAHSSPISALCFDPSGTLLVTASEHGNDINIFRIIPSSTCHRSHSQNHDWCSTCVHLYKLHRGIRAAVIQDICFSQNSQWIAIVSSKGTCHVFVLSPFGGDVGFKTLNSQGEEPSLSPVLTLPWWSMSTFSASQLSSPPPSPVSLSVVSRIRAGNSGLLNTVSNAAASVSGQTSVPSGALAAIFHSTMCATTRPGHIQENTLEHLLVYTPSGHVVQHVIQPLFRTEQNDGSSSTQLWSSLKVQDVELSICVRPVQWWDVCRQSDWPEREESISEIFLKRKQAPGVILRDSSNNIHDRGSALLSSHDRSCWYLSKAEVQYNVGRLPIWQNPKISFGLMEPPRFNGFVFGEIEIEMIPASEVEIRWKDLLPVFDHFHSIESTWNERGPVGGRHVNALSLDDHYPKVRALEETIISHSKPASLSSTESSDGGLSRRMDHFFDLDHTDTKKPYIVYQTSKGFSHDRYELDSHELSLLDKKLSAVSIASSEQLISSHCNQLTHTTKHSPSECLLPSIGETFNRGCNTAYQVSALASDYRYSTSVSLIDGSTPLMVHNAVAGGPDILGAFCESLETSKAQNPIEDANDVETGKTLCSEKNILNQEEEEEDMLGSMFASSEEG